MVPTLELYIEIFLAEEYQVDHFEILDAAPLILEAELYLYFTADRRLAKRYPPRLVDWQHRLQAILNSIRDSPQSSKKNLPKSGKCEWYTLHSICSV